MVSAHGTSPERRDGGDSGEASDSPASPPATVPLASAQLEPGGFEIFYRENISRLMAFVMALGASLADAADIAQETMVDAYRSWPKIVYPGAWTKRVAFRKYLRSDVKAERPIEPVRLNPLIRQGLDVAAWEERYEVLRFLGRLPERQRQVMAWTYDGYTTSEIAAELDMKEDAVRANQSRARKTLAALLAESSRGGLGG